jgi:hypothetical protein
MQSSSQSSSLENGADLYSDSSKMDDYGDEPEKKKFTKSSDHDDKGPILQNSISAEAVLLVAL